MYTARVLALVVATAGLHSISAAASCGDATRAQIDGLTAYISGDGTQKLVSATAKTVEAFNSRNNASDTDKACFELLSKITSVSARAIEISLAQKLYGSLRSDLPKNSPLPHEALQALTEFNSDFEDIRAEIIRKSPFSTQLSALVKPIDTWLDKIGKNFDRAISVGQKPSSSNVLFRSVVHFRKQIEVVEYVRSTGTISVREVTFSFKEDNPQTLGTGRIYASPEPENLFRLIESRIAQARGLTLSSASAGRYYIEFDAIRDPIYFSIGNASPEDTITGLADLIQNVVEFVGYEPRQPVFKSPPLPPKPSKDAESAPAEKEILTERAPDLIAQLADPQTSELLGFYGLLGSRPRGVCYYMPTEKPEVLARSTQVYREPSLESSTLRSLGAYESVSVIEIAKDTSVAKPDAKRIVLYWGKITYVPVVSKGDKIEAWFPIITETSTGEGRKISKPRLTPMGCDKKG